jgi:peptidoglycan hydrolase-like protein with peptidoglycan-binding domain
MIKKQYIIELSTAKQFIGIGRDNDPKDVKKVQEWINLWKYNDENWNISLRIDGDFGDVTLAAVRKFQQHFGLGTDGIVGNYTWRQLTKPMRDAFTRINGINDIHDLVVTYAKQHLKAAPHEYNQNEGTWVRAYMDGHEGKEWPWCAGFVQTIVDQASFTIGKSLTDYMPRTYSCDVLGMYGRQKGLLITNAQARQDSGKIKPGDVFLNVKSAGDWTHTGIVTGVEGDWIHTIEGNTNDEGSREGYEVCKRTRNFRTKEIDIFQVREH